MVDGSDICRRSCVVVLDTDATGAEAVTEAGDGVANTDSAAPVDTEGAVGAGAVSVEALQLVKC